MAVLIERVRSKLTVEHCTVVDVVPVAPSLVRIVVRTAMDRRSPVTAGMRFAPGMHFALCVDGSGGLVSSTWRRFTVSDVSDVSDAGTTFAWIGFQAGDRPAANWLRGVRVGSNVHVRSLEPAPRLGLIGPLILVGDETAIGTFAATATKQPSIAAVLLHTDNREDATVPGIDSSLVAHCPSIVDVASLLRQRLVTGVSEAVWVVGGRQLVLATRKVVAAIEPAPAIVARTYWADGKRGME
jgi:hypothetical protein